MMMLAMRLAEQRRVEEAPLRQTEVPLPEPGIGQVRLRIQVCGVCHTDLHTVEGDIHPGFLPITPGHQVVGVIDKIGELSGTPLDRKTDLGDRVGVAWLHSACQKCEFCRRGRENLCPNALFTGFSVNGGYAEYMLADARYVFPISPKLTSEQAAPLLCAGIIGYRSLRQAEIHPGDRLGLVGFGASAHLAIQIARFWNCQVYVYTRSAEHRRHALDLGADWAGDIEEPTPLQLDCAVIFAPSGETVPLTLKKLRPGGTLAINAIHMSPIPELPYPLIYGERTIRSVANATYKDGEEFLQLASKIPIQPTVQVYDLKDANLALNDLKSSRVTGEAVLRVWTGKDA
jgi:propanol-preferring alcohol dehydrogenase